MSRGLGGTQKKVLLLLSAGVGLSLARTPKHYFRVWGGLSYEWKKIGKRSLERAILQLYKSKLVKEQENHDGSITMKLTSGGKDKVVTFNIDNIQIKKPRQWNKKWHMIVFDIPEKHKKAREALREILKRLGFYKYQESIFVFPYPCEDELDYIIEYFNIRPFVRMFTAVDLDNELHLKKIFAVS